MKEIKAFVHRNRIADVIRALSDQGLCGRHCNLSMVDVRGTLQALDAREQDYSLELGTAVITEVKLEFLVADERVEDAVATIRANGRTGQSRAGWVVVYDVEGAWPIGEEED